MDKLKILKRQGENDRLVSLGLHWLRAYLRRKLSPGHVFLPSAIGRRHRLSEWTVWPLLESATGS